VPDRSADQGVAVTGTLYHGCAIVDHTTRSLAPEMAVLVADGRVGWLGPAEEAPDPGPGVEVVDAGGTTAVAGMVDATATSRYLAAPTGSTGPAIRPTSCWPQLRTTPGYWARPACAGPGTWGRRSGMAGRSA
jgi:imidazolonepropionase-like amidohydrolase